jgi:hypothetical protein
MEGLRALARPDVPDFGGGVAGAGDKVAGDPPIVSYAPFPPSRARCCKPHAARHLASRRHFRSNARTTAFHHRLTWRGQLPDLKTVAAF